MTAEPAEVLSGRTLGDFFLLDRLDEGGAGTVYRAHQTGLARPAVVKVLHQRAPAADSSLQRMVREAQLACRVDHLYAVHVYAFGVEDDGLLWIAMELVDGISLDDWLAAHGPMPLDVFVPFFERVAQVVQAAHERGIVHRDIKPSNIMVIEQAGELLPKLLDFGLAKLVEDITGRERPAAQPSNRPADRLTSSDCVLGSASYMAPEAWTKPATVGPAADIYALGVVAFEALTGRRPYRGETFQALGALHCRAPIPSGGPLTLTRALAKRPEDRHDSALDLAAALRMESTAARRRARIQRIGLAAALALTAIVGIAIQGRAMHETRLARQRASDAEHEAAATVLTAELEQGRAALLHDDMTEAQQHLTRAWRGGDHSRSTAFMLARATQPLRAELAQLPAGRGRMWSSSWSPDGRWIATTDDASAQIWDGATYAPLSELRHEDVVYAATWTDPERLVTACGDGSVRIWDAARGDMVRELRLHGRRPRWYAVAAAAGRIAAVDAKGAIAAIWDSSGKVLTEFELSGAGWPAIAFSADGHWLAATGGDAVQVVDAAGRRVATFGEQVRAIAWNPVRDELLVGTATGEALVWRAPGRDQPTPTARLGESVTAVALAPDGARVVIGGEDGTEQIVDVATGHILSQGNYLHARIASLAFSVDGLQLVAAGVSGELAIGDVASGLPVEVLEGPQQQLRGATFGPTGRRVLAASWDGTARVWDARSPYRQWSAPRLSSGFGLFGGVEPDGRYMAITCPGCATRIWDTARDQLLAELPEVGGGGRVPYPIVSARGDRAAVARGAAAEIYELPGGKLLATVAHAAPVTALVFLADGELVSGDAAGGVIRGLGSIALELGGDSPIDALAALPGGQIAAADARGRIRVAPGDMEIDVGIRARMLRPSSDGRRLLVVAYYSERAEPMALVDLERGTAVRLDGLAAYTARWVAGGILSAHADGTARFWTANGVLRHTYTGGARFLADADLSPDGSMVVGGGGDGMLRFWDTATTKPLWVVAAHRPYVMGVHFEGTDIVTRGIGGEVSRWHIPATDTRNYALRLPNP